MNKTTPVLKRRIKANRNIQFLREKKRGGGCHKVEAQKGKPPPPGYQIHFSTVLGSNLMGAQ